MARAGADTSLRARAALWGVCEILSLIVASLLAGLRPHPTRHSISTAWRHMACSPTCSPCELFPAG